MKEIINIQKKIIPEAFALLEKRYNILRNISILQPVGRRALANKLATGERIVRTEIDFLKEQGFIEVNSSGMSITKEGEMIVSRLQQFIYEIRGIENLEEKLRKKLGIQRVIVVPGDSQEDKYVLDDIGKETSKFLDRIIKENDIISVTGGTTMAAVARGISQHTKGNNITVVPARGGLGKKVESQANTIAAEIAGKLKGNYQLLHASDTLSQQALEVLQQDPEIKKIVKIIKSANLLLFGIGRADEMARRRDLSTDTVEKLQDLKAVAEAFGYYFTREGTIVYETKTIGIDIEDFKEVPHAIGVAGGSKKAEAIVAICKLKENMTLVTDEAAAKEILEKY